MARSDDNATDILPVASASGAGSVASGGGSVASGAASPDELAPVVGRMLGKFVVIEPLGRGGSGEVYRAEQPQLGRSAVVKTLRRDVAPAPNRVDRFLREARLASRLDHPYAAHIYGFGAEPDGLLWIAMEHVRGATLDELVARRGPIPPVLFGPLFARLCEVVHTAHELGIVHRDIKGGNVMVIERAGQLLPKLLDFGIAKGLDGPVVTAASGGDDHLTGHGAMLGSPHYMAPEQWDAPAGVDARADIYALGVLAYRCVAGQLPFHGLARAELAAAHRGLAPPPLPATLPAALIEVIARALAKRPEDRWSTALSLGEAMRRAGGGGAPETVPILDVATRDAWCAAGPQPIADAVARLARAATTVETDAALRELVAITCRWLAVLALSQLDPDGNYPAVREHARAVIGNDDAAPWLRLARAAVAAAERDAPRAAHDGERSGSCDAGHSTVDGERPDTRDDDRARPGGERSRTGDDVHVRLDRPDTRDDRARPGGERSRIGDDDRVRLDGERPDTRDDHARPDGDPPRTGDDERARTADAMGEDRGTLLPALAAVLAGTAHLETLAGRLDDRDRQRTAAALSLDVSSLADALQPLEVLLAYQLVVGRTGGAESWQGVRRRDRERVVVWGELADGVVALLDGTNRVAATLSPLAQIVAPFPSSEPELFLLWRTGRGQARLVAAPWGFERDDDAAAHRLALLTTEDADTEHDASERSPYPGLAAYGAADAAQFVGREREIEALANRLVRAPLIAVLGPSGAGKSSFLHAGLVPRLAEHHETATMRPGRHPMRAIATLAREVSGSDAADDASPHADSIVARLRAAGERAPRGLVIVVDQFEELVTLCDDADERTRFAELLAAVAGAGVRVVATLRDDFATAIESEDAIRGRFEVFVLATPAPEALRRIVIEPARRAGVAIDPEVVEDIVAEVAGRPASLPLVSFTCARLWEARDSRTTRRISHDAYLALGGVAGALSTYADQIYASFGRREQDTVRDLFARLVAVDGTRIPAPRAELEQLTGIRAGGVLANLIDARLLVVRDADGIDVVEIVHECLAERWPRLARWRSEDAADRALLADVGLAARRWHDAGRRADLLWRGEALAELERLAARSTALTELERAFTAHAALAHRRARRLRRAILGGVMVALAAIAIGMAYLGLAANRSRSDAERAAGRARDAAALAEERLTRSLLAQGRRELNDGRAMAALAYFAEAMRRGADTPALRLVVTLASRAWRDELVVRRDARVTALAASPAGWAVAGDQDGRLRWWTTDGKPLGETTPEIGYVSGLYRQPDDRLIAFGPRRLVVIDPKTRAVAHRFEPASEALIAHLGPGPDELTTIEAAGPVVYDLAGHKRRSAPAAAREAMSTPRFSASGSHVVLAADDVQLVDLTAMTTRTIATKVDGPVGATDDGSVFGYVDKDGLVHVHATAGGAELRTFRPANRPHTVMFSPDGKTIATQSDNGIVVHDATGKPIYGIPSIKSTLVLVEVRGDDIWVGNSDGTAQRYHRGVLVASLPSQLGEFSELVVEGHIVMTAGNDGGFVMLRGDAEQLRVVPRACETQTTSVNGIAVGYRCERDWAMFVGTHAVGRVATDELGSVAYHAPSDRAAIATEHAIDVFEHGRRIAGVGDRAGPITFEDRDHLLVAIGERVKDAVPGIYRFTIANQRWDRLATIDADARHASISGATIDAGSMRPRRGSAEPANPKTTEDSPDRVTSLIVAAGGVFAGTARPEIVVVRPADGAELARVTLSARPLFLATSGDGRWVAAQLRSGTTAILDGTTGAVVRELEPTDAIGTAATLDATGDLVVRPGRGTMTIWDRATGDALVWNLDLLRDASNARFDTTGRLEVATWEVGLLDLPIDRRPVTAILRDIDCNLPLRVVDGRLGPATPACR